MGLRSLIGLVVVALSFSFIACDSDKAQRVEPETRGKRGETCLARNDCASGLACINGVCSKNEFDIDVSAKHCDRIECSTDEECCGERATMAPAKCNDRDQICSPQPVPGCIQTSCQTSATCNGGSCPMGVCAASGDPCATDTECAEACLPSGVCRSNGFTPCTVVSQCPYYLSNLTCSLRSCNCQNPLYDPSDPICDDPDCENICNLRCEDQLCVQDDSCETDLDCPATASLCDGGRCVQCTEDANCDEDNNETCEKGQCYRPCEFNEECGLFEICDAGDCLYVGCKTNRECILAAARGLEGVGGGVNQGTSGDDARLSVCLESETEAGVGICRIPCENDGNCGQFQVCEAGYCKFVGCDNDDECRAYLGIANQVVNEAKPYVAKAECNAESSN